MAFAEGTSVPIERSRAEIERLVTRFGCQRFGSMLDPTHATIMFISRGRGVRFTLPLPPRDDKRFLKDGRGALRGIEARQRAMEQEHRRLWRALALVVKAKLEAVESGITTFEHEFLAHFVTPDGLTLGDKLIPNLDRVCIEGTANPMLLLGGGP